MKIRFYLVIAAILAFAFAAFATGTRLTSGVAEVGELREVQNNQQVNLVKTLRVPITRVAAGTEQDTGIDLPAGAVVIDVFVDVRTAETTGTTRTFDLGLLSGESGGDADGFLDNISTVSAGRKVPSLVSGSVTRGALLRETVTGSGAATHSSPVIFPIATARSITYTLGSANWAEFVGEAYIVYALPFVP